MMRTSQRRARYLLAVLTVLLALVIVPRYARAEEAELPEAEVYEAEELVSEELAPEELAPEELEEPETDAEPIVSEEPELVPQADETSTAVTVKNVRLYDLDGTQQTLSDDYDCQKRFVIVGRPGCANTRNVVSQALSCSTDDEFADVSFLVLDIDGDWNTFNEDFSSIETERVRFFSSNSSSYSNWVWWAYEAMGNEGGSVTLPFTVLIDKSNHVQAVFTGPQDVETLCRTYLGGNESNPDDVDPGDPDQFGTWEDVEPEDPTVYDELSFSVWGNADMSSGRELLDLVNEAREAVGAPALTWDEELAQTAQQRGAEQMVLYSHTRPNGRSCFTAWPASQRSYTGENIAMGQVAVTQVNTSWTNSEGHYANMINPDFTTFAAAHFKSESGEHYWVECFGGGVGSGVTGAPVMGEVLTTVGAVKGNVNLRLCATPGVYYSSMGMYDRSIPELKVGQSQQLSLVVGDADVDAADVIWTSSDPSVVTIDETGKFVGVSVGTADVSASLASYPNLTVTNTVTVTEGEYSRSGEWGTCPWEIDDEGTLLVYPGVGEDSDSHLTSPVSYWIDYSADIKAVRFVEQDGRKAVAPENCAYLFGGLTNLVSADLTGLDASKATHMHGLFAGCGKLRDVNMSGLDTSSLVNMGSMFLDCVSLESLDLSGFDTSHVGSMYYLFQGCTALKDLDVSGWDTSQVDDMDGMFRYCASLTSLDLSSWDTSSLNWDNFVYPMFEGCTSLADLHVGEGYVMSDEKGFPDATAESGLWWSAARQEWLSKSDILAGALGQLDIFANYEVSADELPASVSNAEVSVEGCVYTGQPVEPAVVVTFDGVELEAGRDYVLAYADNLNAGTGTVTVKGKGDYVGTTSATFQIAPKPVAELSVTAARKTFTGAAVTTTVTVKHGSKSLVSGTDFTISGYRNNVNAGTATVTIAGKGNYTGSKSVSFEIAPKAVTVKANDARKVLGATDPKLTATVTGTVGSDTVAYALSRAAGEEMGTYDITVTGEAWQGNYRVTYVNGTFTIGQKDISDVTVAAIAAQTYTGGALQPTPVVKDGVDTLAAGTDYTVSYRNNVNAGTATVVLTGKGNYTGTKSVTFKIGAKSISGVTVSSVGTQKWTGDPIKPTPTVKDGTKTLKSGTDYKLTYKNNKEPGTATITVTGCGNYTGTKSVTFRIGAKTGTWRQSGGRWWYQYKDGTYPASRFADIDGGRYYFDASGYMVTGWRQVGGKWYYFRSDGRMAANDWAKSGNKWCYLNADGTMATGWLTLSGKIYWMDGSGYMVTGWKQISGKWYYFESSGAMSKNKWVQSGSRWCYLRADGTMATGWLEVSGKRYYMDANGYMVTGWKQISGKYYYFESSGAMARSKWVGNYYLQADGTMAVSKWIGNYHVDSTGKWDKTR